VFHSPHKAGNDYQSEGFEYQLMIAFSKLKYSGRDVKPEELGFPQKRNPVLFEVPEREKIL